MDDELKQLAELLTTRIKPESESSITVKWAAIITILIVLFGSLFTIALSNVSRIIRLETQYTFTVESLVEFKKSQERVEVMVSEIRQDQKRREAKELR